MTKDQFKAMLIELIKEGAIDLDVNGYSTEYSHYVAVSLNIDGETYLQSETDLTHT